MWQYSENLRALYETPVNVPDSPDATARKHASDLILQHARKSGRTILTEFESKKILEAYHIPTVETRIAHSVDEAVKAAQEIGYPVVLKLHSETITHKTDVGGVQLNLRTAAAVRRAYRTIETSVAKFVKKQNATPTSESHESPPHNHASHIKHQPPFLGVTVQPMVKLEGYELIFGSSLDPQFGPVLLFGTGGQLVEVFKDRALALPPLNGTLARRLMERTRIYHALKGVRGRKPIDLPALEQLLVRFSQLVVEQPWISEIDINPLVASPEGLIALDARVLLHGQEVNEDSLPKPAIRPYPSHYVKTWTLPNKTHVTLRPIRPEDEPVIAKFHETLSEQSVYYRYFAALKLPQRIAHERLMRICFNDYDREIALVVDYKKPNASDHEILGVGRLSKVHGTNEAEFALLVSDPWQKQGLGTELLKLLVQVGRSEKLDRIIGYILLENRAMQHLCQKAGFELVHDAQGGEYKAVIQL
jgi:acetyltransferase